MRLTPSEETLIAQARALCETIVTPHAAQWERERRIGHDGLKAAVDIGLTRLQVPSAWGGLDMSFSCKAQMADVLAAGDFGFTMSLLNTQNVAAKLARDASPEIAARYVPDLIAAKRLGCTALTEPGAGSDFAAITTFATPVEGGWKIDGAKAWITNAGEADVIVLYAQTERGSGGRGIAGFLVDGRREGFAREPAFALGGQHTIGTGGFKLNGYIARDDEMLHPPGQAFKAALGSINGARTYIAAMCCGMVGEALKVVTEFGESRSSFGKSLADHQGWRWRLAEASSELAASRMMVAHAASLIDAKQDAQLAAAQAKLLATRMADRQLPILAQAMGAEGLREHYPFARHLMGARVAGFVDGSTEMLLERICAVMRSEVR
jgi:alkylation response protein AidB-like acyl-CoA dehydrogenase